VAGSEMTDPSRRRIVSRRLVPVSIAVLLLFMSDMKMVRGVHGYEWLSTETFNCNGSQPCVHQAQQGNLIPSKHHGFREALDINIANNASEVDPNGPCPTTGLFITGTRSDSFGPQASRLTIFK
jgi:hypothetical protein